eukprot:EG_transcript_34638
MNGLLLGLFVGTASGLLTWPWVVPPKQAGDVPQGEKTMDGGDLDRQDSDEDEDEDEEEEDEEEEEEEEESKMVLVVRKDLKLTEPQAASACCSAALKAYTSTTAATAGSPAEWKEWLRLWERAGTRKVALRGNDEAELLAMAEQAAGRRLPHALARAATKATGGTPQPAVLAIGPGPISVIDG